MCIFKLQTTPCHFELEQHVKLDAEEEKNKKQHLHKEF